jgi:hypothetical protein
VTDHAHNARNPAWDYEAEFNPADPHRRGGGMEQDQDRFRRLSAEMGQEQGQGQGPELG